MRRLALIAGVLGGTAAVITATRMYDRSRNLPPTGASLPAGRPAAAAPAGGAAESGLDPDPAIVHYHFTIASEADATTLIAQLQARANAPGASQYDSSDLAEMYFHRAQVDGNLEDYATAEALAKKSLAIMPEPNGANLLLAKIMGARHDFAGAIAIAKAELAHKASAGAFGILATDYLAIGELDDAAAAAESMLAIVPSTGGYLTRALVEQAQGRDREAAFDFTRSCAVEAYGGVQESTHARALWGRFLMKRGDAAGAAMVIDEALRIAPGNPLALAQRGELWLRTGKVKEARGAFEQAFASSRQVRYLIDLARAQALGGDAEGARGSRTQAEKLIRTELAASGLGHRLDLVEILADGGTSAGLTEALALGKAELEHRPSADVRFQVARVMAGLGLQAEAAVQVHAILATGVHDARFYELASRVEQGPRAALYAREARRLDPGGSEWRTLGLATFAPAPLAPAPLAPAPLAPAPPAR